MSVCYIIAAGDCEEISIEKKEKDLVIAADAGVRYCERDDIIPDVIIIVNIFLKKDYNF